MTPKHPPRGALRGRHRPDSSSAWEAPEPSAKRRLDPHAERSDADSTQRCDSATFLGPTCSVLSLHPSPACAIHFVGSLLTDGAASKCCFSAAFTLAGKPPSSRSEAESSSNQDDLALYSAISDFCEADLMALDEDLKEVPWGEVSSGAGHHQVLSPLSALGMPALPAWRAHPIHSLLPGCSTSKPGVHIRIREIERARRARSVGRFFPSAFGFSCVCLALPFCPRRCPRTPHRVRGLSHSLTYSLTHFGTIFHSLRLSCAQPRARL